MNGSSRPIYPSEVQIKPASSIPGEVFEAFNEFIADRWDGNHAHFTEQEVLDLILSKFQKSTYINQITKWDIIERKWLNIERLYRDVGWLVEYKQIGDSYASNFIFKKLPPR